MTTIRSPGDLVAGAVLWAAAAIIIQQSGTWPASGDVAGNPVVFPRALAGIMLLCGAALIFVRRPAPLSDDGPNTTESRPARALLMALAATILANTLDQVGLIVGGTVFLLVLQRLAGASWRTAVPFAVGTPFLMWLLFIKALKVPLPTGEIWARLF